MYAKRDGSGRAGGAVGLWENGCVGQDDRDGGRKSERQRLDGERKQNEGIRE
jgi:hypothetical protein